MPFLPESQVGHATTGALEVPFYDSGGRPGQTPIVLLHGTGGSAENNFSSLYPMLAMRHRVIALDFVDPHRSEVSIEHYVQQAVSVIGACSPRRPVTIVGYSFGAVVAATLAATHPDLVENLVLVNGWIRTDTQQQLRNDLWMRLRDEGSTALGMFMVLQAFSPRFLRARTAVELEELVKRTASGPDRHVKMLLNRSVDITAALARISCPSLVIGSTEDQMTPLWHSELLFGGIEKACFASITSGHAVVHERPAELFTLIDNFLDQPEAVSPGTVLATGHA